MCPRRTFDDFFFFFFFFFPLECGIPQDPNIQKKKQKPKYLAKKKKHIRERLGRGNLNTCKISGSYLSTTAWTLDSEGIWGSMLEPACRVVCGIFSSNKIAPDRKLYYTRRPLTKQHIYLRPHLGSFGRRSNATTSRRRRPRPRFCWGNRPARRDSSKTRPRSPRVTGSRM